MSFATSLRSGLKIIANQTRTVQGIVKHYAWTGQDQFGNESYAYPVDRKAIITERIQDRPGQSGQVTRTTAHLLFLDPIEPNGTPGRLEPIDTRDKIVLPDGSSNPIVETNGLVDPDTTRPFFMEIWLGLMRIGE